MAKIDESHKSAQEDELIVLQSIFCNGELKINKAAAAWNAWAPIDVCIKIVPTAHSNTFVSLTVHITCSDKYPAQPPQITFDHVEGVPAADVDELLKEMNDLCSERASEKMPAISEICELARDYLYQFNKKGPGDMNQTMLENNKKKETEKQMLNDLNRQREKAEIELENNSRLERLNAKKEEKERENRMKLVSLSEGNEDRGECFKVKALDDSTLTIYKSKNEAAPSRKLPHPDISEWIAHINEGELKRRALVTEWRFEFTLGRGKKQSPSGLMDLRKFESDLDEFVANTLRRLRSLDSIDQALYSYLFIHLIKRFTSPTNFKCSVLVGHNIDPQHRPLQMAIGEARTKWRIMLPIFASSAVCALKWIHDQHLYHGSIDHSSIWIHRNPDYTFKISDFFLVPSLLKLANDFAQITTPDDRKSLSPPVEAKESLKSAQQRDIAAVGVIMMDIHGESASDDLCTQFEELCLQGSVNADNLLDHEYLNRGFFDNLQMSKSNASDDPVGTYEFQKSSRLMSEWAMRTHLGGGGFGDVILAKNKVDGNDYAIKRIRLIRQSEQINRKITREAKIFSKLNHTNIVRYYNAWIEDVNVGGAGSTETDNSTRDALSDDSIIYRNAQDLKTTETTSEWTTSFRRVDDSRAGSGSSRSVSQIGFFANQPRAQVVFSPQLDASSGSEFDVLFVKSHDGGGDELTDEPTELDDMDASSLTLTQQNKVLYIQMEFCPRSTLRNLISSGDLYLQPKKVWRIFREILNGLQYIHHQGLVHRDIKPMNILLGVNDQVKIGDFGLATRGEVKKRKDDADSTLSPTSIETTRDVGTVFYMAPECDAGNMEKSDEPRTKIDVYSAGVVLFELFYSPLTGMERVDVLKSLRASLAFPDDYGSDLSREQTTTVQKLAKWMLQQKPENRPTVDQILASDQVPLVELEDNDFQKMFSQVIRNKKGSLRDWTMRNLFETATTSATNYLFDKALCEELAKTKNFAKHSYIEKIEDELSSCLKIHAFMPLTTQSLLPYSKTRTGSDTSPVKVMDESGFVFTLPPCLRKNFIRYCNHAQISRSKRYSFGKTFHRTDGGLHPIERLVCAVDVVGQTSTAELMAAEVLSIVTALTAELSCLSSLNWVLRVGHTMLVKSAMNHHGLTDEDLQKRVLAMLNDKLSKSSLTRVEKQNYLMHMCALSSEQASALLESLESSPKLSNVRASMRSFARIRTMKCAMWPRVRCKNWTRFSKSLMFFARKDKQKRAPL